MNDNAPVTSPDPTVLWWPRRPDAGVEVGTRVHRFGWTAPGLDRTGTLTIPTTRPWLDRPTIETELTTQLTELLAAELQALQSADTELVLVPAGEHLTDLDPVIRLQVGGADVHLVDLTASYGLEVIAGVVAELRGRDVWSQVFLETSTAGATRTAAARWAEHALEQFAHASPGQLLDHGWTQTQLSRWQLLGRQP